MVANKNKFKKPKKVFMKFDIRVLNMMIGYLFKESTIVTRKALNNMKKLFDAIDTSSYDNNEKLSARVTFIHRALDAKLNKGFESLDMVLNYCMSDMDDPENDEIIRNVPIYSKLNYEEIKSINKAIEDRLTYAYLMEYRDSFYRSIERLDTGDFNSFYEINNELKGLCTDFITTTRKAKSLEDSESISLTDDDVDDKYTAIVESLKNPSSILTTGIQRFNELLSPGFMSQRLYCFMGLPGGFKSGLLLKIVRDIKKYNAGIKPRKPGKIPTVLLVTMENKVDETIERLFNMVASDSDIRQFTPKQVIKMLKKDGELTVTDQDNIDIVIKYKPNRSIDTGDLYTIISDLEDEGKEVIALVLDYLKRIKPAEYAKDEKEELKNITNELKTLAIELNIPVITAHQLNRAAAAAVDSAVGANKDDVTHLLGRANVGSAYEIIENCDWICIINVERKRSSGQYFLTFKLVKIRYKPLSDLVYFSHPFFANGRIRLVDDVDLPKSISELSLKADMATGDGSRTKKNAIDREVVDINVNGERGDATAEDLFNFDSHIGGLNVERTVA